MKLQDIYDQLSYGELRLLNLGSGEIDNADEGMPIESFKKMLPTIQLGLTALHKTFLLREGTVAIPLVNGQVSYVIAKNKDAPSTFEDNLLKIERIYGFLEDEEYEIPLNRISNKAAIRTPSHNTLLVPTNEEDAPWLKETSELRVVYRADHPSIRAAVANQAPMITEIFLPVAYLQALLYFIASRMHNPVGMSEQFHEGNNYAMKYQQEIMTLKMENFEIDDDDDNDRIRQGGWV